MDTITKVGSFIGYLKQNDPSLFEVFKDSGDLGLYPDPNNPRSVQFNDHSSVLILASDPKAVSIILKRSRK